MQCCAHFGEYLESNSRLSTALTCAIIPTTLLGSRLSRGGGPFPEFSTLQLHMHRNHEGVCSYCTVLLPDDLYLQLRWNACYACHSIFSSSSMFSAKYPAATVCINRAFPQSFVYYTSSCVYTSGSSPGDLV